MGLFDKMHQAAMGAANEIAGAAKNFAGTSSQTITFDHLPETLEQMQALPQASLTNPFEVAALITCAFCVYSVDPNEGERILMFPSHILREQSRQTTTVPTSRIRSPSPLIHIHGRTRATVV